MGLLQAEVQRHAELRCTALQFGGEGSGWRHDLHRGQCRTVQLTAPAAVADCAGKQTAICCQRALSLMGQG
jgi:hypothetical protein